MKLSGLHILLTYKCTCECDHCFVWGSPRQNGVLTIDQLGEILHQALEAGVESIYFEGGEPFLYYPVLVRGVHLAADMGFQVGIVSNAYWASSVSDASEWLQPLAGRLSDLTISSDLYHCTESLGEKPQNALVAAKWMHIPTGLISVEQPEQPDSVMFRGRAAQQLAPRASLHPWDGFTACPHEDLVDPGRVHLDPFGNLHICQGLVIGNLFEQPLRQLCDEYDPASHPICGLLLEGGPAALITEYGLQHEAEYADACHLCYRARQQLRSRFPSLLGPDQMYGVVHER